MRTHYTFKLLTAAAVLMMSGANVQATAHQDDEAEFENVETRPLMKHAAEASLSVKPPLEARRVLPVTVDAEAFRELALNEEFTLALHDREYRLVVDRKEASALNTVIAGHFVEHEDALFTLAIVGDAVAGWFLPMGSSSEVRLRYGGPGVHYLHEVDAALVPECAGAMVRPKRALARDPEAQRASEMAATQAEIQHMLEQATDGAEGGCTNLPDSYFDILVVYTNLAINAAGSVNAIRAEGALAVANMTLALQNSNLQAQARLVWYLDVSYNESGDQENHLDRLTDPRDGIMDGVHPTRVSCEADFVVLLVADTGSTGLGWCDSDHDSAFSIARWSLAASNFTLAHEVGHNLGCAHNPEDVDCYPYENARGHHFFVPAEKVNRNTVMSYSVNSSSRIPQYSSPDINYMGVATGTSTRNNRDRISVRRITCANFRVTRMDVWLDFNGGFGSGTFSNPFNSLPLAIGRLQNDGQYLPQLPILHIKSGSSGQAVTINKAMEIRSCGGTVTIGQ